MQTVHPRVGGSLPDRSQCHGYMVTYKLLSHLKNHRQFLPKSASLVVLTVNSSDVSRLSLDKELVDGRLGANLVLELLVGFTGSSNA